MKSILDGMKSYIILMFVISSVMTIACAALMFIFGSDNGKTIGDVLQHFWIDFYFTGSLLGGAAYKYHIVGLIFFGALNLIQEKQ